MQGGVTVAFYPAYALLKTTRPHPFINLFIISTLQYETAAAIPGNRYTPPSETILFSADGIADNVQQLPSR